MPETVDLSVLGTIDMSKQLSLVQAGQMTLDDYLDALQQAQKVSAHWDGADRYIIDFGRGIRDPFGSDLTVPELIQVVNALMPSPLTSAGKTIVLRGPMPGWVSGRVARICYAAHVIIESLDRAQGGLLVQVPVERLERDRVRLLNPDTSERERPEGTGRVLVSTSQLSYRRGVKQPPFDYHGVLSLVFIETRDPKHARPRAQVQDSHGYYAWVNELAFLQDVP